jgi:hypothetical protein
MLCSWRSGLGEKKGKRKGRKERGKTNMKAGKQAGNHIFLAMTVVNGLPMPIVGCMVCSL